MAQASPAEDLVRKSFQVLNAPSAANFADDTSPDVGKQLAAGRAEWQRDFSAVQWNLSTVTSSGDKVAFSYQAHGTHRASNKPVQWQGSGVARISDGKISEIALLEDAWARLLQIGQLPSLPSDSATGHWTGELFGIKFTLDLVQGSGADVKGTLAIPGFGTFAVTGKNTPPTINFSGSAGGTKVDFAGKWTGPNQITGDIAGLAKNVVLNRR
jgi:ketosteroid isomerase-like protein